MSHSQAKKEYVIDGMLNQWIARINEAKNEWLKDDKMKGIQFVFVLCKSILKKMNTKASMMIDEGEHDHQTKKIMLSVIRRGSNLCPR